MFDLYRGADEIVLIDEVFHTWRNDRRYTQVSYWKGNTRYSCIVRDGIHFEVGSRVCYEYLRSVMMSV